MASRLSIHGTADQIAVRLTHSGPTAGLKFGWGDTPPKKVKNPNPPPSNWHVDWVPFYLWFSGLSGNVGAAGQVAPVSVGFSDIFEQHRADDQHGRAPEADRCVLPILFS